MTTPQPAALQPKPAGVSDDAGKAFYELSCDACGMSPSWGALTWGALTQNERDRQRQAATRFLALRPAQQATPEPVQRLCRYAGQTMRTARNPNITAREAIEIGDYLAAIGITAQGAKGEQT